MKIFNVQFSIFKNIPLILLLVLSCISIFDLLHPGYPVTHDGDVHLLRLTSFYQSLSEGIIIPRWAGNVNWGYGQGVFEFFYPLPSYIASLLHVFGVSFANSLKILLEISMVFSGLAMYLWMSKAFGKTAGFISGVLYIFAPFRFVDVYVRGDIGESLAYIFIPLILFFLYLASEKKNTLSILGGGVSFALLILCHNVMSLMFLPFILGYALFLWFVKKKQIQVLRSFVLIFLFAFGLSAFFWIPGLFEAKYTLRDIVTKGEYAKRFVDMAALLYGPWSYGGSGLFTVQLGIMQWLTLIGAVCILPFLVIKKRYVQVTMLVSLLIYCSIAIYMMLPISNGIWGKVPLLQNFQFPWRFLAITVFSCAAISGIILSLMPKKTAVVICTVATVFLLIANKGYWHAKGFIQRPDNYFSGTINAPSDTGESSPIWSIRFMEHGYSVPMEVISGNTILLPLTRTSIYHKYFVFSKTSSRLLENTLYFPGWEVLVDGKVAPIEFQDELYRGLITFTIPQGKHTIEIKFTHTKIRLYAEILSFCTCIIVLAICVLLAKDFYKKKNIRV